MTFPTPGPPLNALLAALPSDVLRRIGPSLDTMPLRLKQVLQNVGQPIDHFYFPGGGFCSIVTVFHDGTMVEVATVGRKGVLGMSAVSRGGLSPSMTMVQGEGDTCYRMSAAMFHEEMGRREAFFSLMTRFSDALTGFIMQSAACNAMHSVEQRLARWLLHAHDRMGRDQFQLTHEVAAMMLGASRPTVTIVAGTLQAAGLITYHRGQITIVDRQGLQAASCECYDTVTEMLRMVVETERGAARPAALLT